MNQNAYIFGIFFFGLAVLCGLFQSIVHLWVGNEMIFLQSFGSWFLAVNLVNLAGTFFLLKYLHAHKFKLAFTSGLMAALFNLAQVIFMYVILITVARELYPYNAFFTLLALVAALVFAGSLVFTQAGKSPWLKPAGVLMLFTNFALIIIIISSLLVRDVSLAITLDKLSRWVVLVSTFIPVFFILNFRRGLSGQEAAKVLPPQKDPWELWLGAAGILALMAVFYFGLNIYHASYWNLNWRKKGPEQARQLAKAYEARTFVNSHGDTLHYLWMKPVDYQPEKKYPLVVCLHGGTWGVQPAERHLEVPEPAPFLATPENRKKYPAFLFLPQCPVGQSWGGIPQIPAADSLVMQTIKALEAEFRIDTTRRYVAGGSGGGYGSWHLIGTRPKMFAAAIPFCGAGNPDLAPNMVDVPVWAFHGSVDRNVPVSGSRQMVAAIQKAGGQPRYTEFPNVGHNVWPHIAKTPGVLDWLFAQQRD